MYEQEAWVSFSAKWMATVGMATNTASITLSVIVIVCFVMFARDSVRFSHSFGSTRLTSNSASSHTDATDDKNNNRHKHSLLSPIKRCKITTTNSIITVDTGCLAQPIVSIHWKIKPKEIKPNQSEIIYYTMASMSFSGGKQMVRPPQRGIFPLDHEAECKPMVQVCTIGRMSIILERGAATWRREWIFYSCCFWECLNLIRSFCASFPSTTLPKIK